MKNLKKCQGISLITLIIIVAIILCVILIFNTMNNNSKLNTVVTADNYDTIGNIFNENYELMGLYMK